MVHVLSSVSTTLAASALRVQCIRLKATTHEAVLQYTRCCWWFYLDVAYTLLGMGGMLTHCLAWLSPLPAGRLRVVLVTDTY